MEFYTLEKNFIEKLFFIGKTLVITEASKLRNSLYFRTSILHACLMIFCLGLSGNSILANEKIYAFNNFKKKLVITKREKATEINCTTIFF